MKIDNNLKGVEISVFLDGGVKITGEYKGTMIDKTVSDDPVVIVGLYIIDATKVIAFGRG